MPDECRPEPPPRPPARVDQRLGKLEPHLRQHAVSPEGRTPLAVDLLLDRAVRLPDHVAQEIERAASALLRLTWQPTGEATWRDYHSASIFRTKACRQRRVSCGGWLHARGWHRRVPTGCLPGTDGPRDVTEMPMACLCSMPK
ncbi:MAG: lantibiotic dehydratase [Haloechinothrix sp.]